jgi:ubiquinone/menaquinone biosynthesis C-methylase UbiE
MSAIPSNPVDELYEVLCGARLTAAVAAFVKLGFADALDGVELSAQQLAASQGTHAPSTQLLLSALASMKQPIVTADAASRYTLTTLGKHLCSTHPESQAAAARLQGVAAMLRTWGQIAAAIKTGKSAFEFANGRSFFEYLRFDAEAGRLFNAAMVGLGARFNDAIIEAYPAFSRVETIVDVGGGTGSLLCALLRRYLGPEGVLHDQPEVLTQAAVPADLGARIRLLPGDMFRDELPPADLYVAKFILHDWADADAIRVLGNIRRAMRAKPSSRLLVMELDPAPSGDGFSMAPWMSLSMALLLGSHERSAEQYSALAQASHLRVRQSIRTGTPLRILECAI